MKMLVVLQLNGLCSLCVRTANNRDLYKSLWLRIYMALSVNFDISTKVEFNPSLSRSLYLCGTEFCFKHFGGLGQPRMHLLTTGRSAFVNKKKLVFGDVVLFLRLKCVA